MYLKKCSRNKIDDTFFFFFTRNDKQLQIIVARNESFIFFLLFFFFFLIRIAENRKGLYLKIRIVGAISKYRYRKRFNFA